MRVQKEITLFIQESLNAERKHNKDLDILIRDFKKYKSGGRVDYLGKDVPYHKPQPMAENAGLMHVHVLDKVKSVKFRTSDSVIIYTEGATSINTFYIIDFIDNGAHEKARNKDYMNWVIKKAEEFREVK
ncbi:type II toxin-antitoxin system YafO family toxin [Pseudoalteromonas sp. ASV78]|uniref:type II toxin-antitoxin system YafO family toxin n=1 Tax=Pseudoalteromonas sp. ASV78 TaxID=3397851 RepID=UPI0039FBB9C9